MQLEGRQYDINIKNWQPRTVTNISIIYMAQGHQVKKYHILCIVLSPLLFLE